MLHRLKDSSIRLTKLLSIMVLFLSFVASPSISQALIYSATPIDQAVRQADLIVYVSVGKQEVVQRAQQNSQKKGRLFTLSTVHVHQAIKGTVTNSIQVVQVGGSQSGLTQMIAGSTQLKEGERWVLFLRRASQSPDEWVITGGRHGARRIKVRTSDGAKVVESQLKPSQLQVLKPRLRPIKLAPTQSLKRVQARTLKVRPKTGSRPQTQVLMLKEYLDQLKTLVDRSQAPLNPTH